MVRTPNRLIDLLPKHEIELDDAFVLVPSGVNCMLQSSFSDKVIQTFRTLSQPRVLMFPATISCEIEKVASSMAQDVVGISMEKSNMPNRVVKQMTILVPKAKQVTRPSLEYDSSCGLVVLSAGNNGSIFSPKVLDLARRRSQ